LNQLLVDPISRLICGNGADVQQFVIQNVVINLYNILGPGYSYGSVFRTWVVTIRSANLTLTLPIGKPTASYGAT